MDVHEAAQYINTNVENIDLMWFSFGVCPQTHVRHKFIYAENV